MHKHHRKRRSQGGGDEPANIIEVPDALHQWIHDHPDQAYEIGLLVHSWEDPEDISISLPEEVIDTVAKVRKKAKVEKKDEKPRPKVNVTIKVPKDEQEDGAEALRTLIDECRSELLEEMGWQENVPPYFVLIAVLHDWLSGR
jgi:hypothetical protein